MKKWDKVAISSMVIIILSMILSLKFSKLINNYLISYLIEVCFLFLLFYPLWKTLHIKNERIKKITILVMCSIVFVFRFSYIKVINYLYYKAHPKEIKREYIGKYKGKIEEKYPKEFAKAKSYHQIILNSIKSNKKTRDENNFYFEYFDEKGRLVYKIKQPSKIYEYKRTYPNLRGGTITKEGKSVESPEEIGYIYDTSNRIESKIYIKLPGDNDIYDLDENNWDNFLKNGSAHYLKIFEYKYLSENEKIIIEEECIKEDKYLNKKERRYINDVLVSEKELIDEESDRFLIMLNTEKKYNSDGKLVFKIVERIDKTSEYKSYTEMDFENNKAVTKYYKDKNVIAIITEDFLGEEKTMLDIEMWKGEEISRFYKMQEKSIVKREKKGSSLLIYDVYSYGQKEGEIFDRYIVDKGKLVYIFENCKAGWEWSYTRAEEGLNENSCYIDHIKNERMLMISELGNYKKYEYDNNSKKYNLIQNDIFDSSPEDEGTWFKGGQHIHNEFAQGIVNTDFDKKVSVNKRVLRKGIDEKEVIFNEKEFYKKIEATLSKK